ncbi:MAG TPA: Gfo/Idh/MocA family oxidoreductase [Capsulimonadaceae bacterium]|jgi:predicted dehydrogenase
MNRLRIGIVGLGFGKHIVNELLKSPAKDIIELAAVCDTRPDLTSEVAATAGCKAYTSLDDLLNDPTIPAIGLYTGPNGRAELIRRIVDSGRDVMTTKPLEIDPDAALKSLQHAAALGRTVHLNSPSPRLPAELAQISIWQQQYDLGRPVACRRDVWVSYNESADGSWYDDPELCPVAPVYRLGIYLINDLVRLFGAAEQVTILQSRLRTGRPTADSGQLGILFKNGVIANIFASFCVLDGDHYRNGIVLNFERGTIYGNVGPNRPNGCGVDLSLVQERNNKRQIVASVTCESYSGGYDWATFAAAVRGETQSGLISPEEAVQGVRLIVAMKEALRNNGAAQVKG